jgi:hypothetical protein
VIKDQLFILLLTFVSCLYGGLVGYHLNRNTRWTVPLTVAAILSLLFWTGYVIWLMVRTLAEELPG